MRAFPLSLLGLLLLASPALARNVSEPGFFKCLEGDCRNGAGVVSDLYLHVTMRGRFSGGETIPGEEYVVASPLAPGRAFKQIYGADGLLASGDSPRTVALMGTKIGNFHGVFKAFQHPFTQRPTAVISEGSYDTGIGITYNGQFRYIPSKVGSDTGFGFGYYIFFGDRFDEVENEHKAGLFVSNVTGVGQYVQFQEANAEYLLNLQEKYRAEMHLAQSERASASSLWKSVFSVVGTLALNMSGAAGGLGGGGSGLGIGGVLSGGLGLDASLLGGSGGMGGIGGNIALNLVSSLFDGNAGINFEDAARGAIAAAVPNSAAGNAIAAALLDNRGNGGDLGSALLNAAGNAAIANVDRKLAPSLGGGVGGNLAANSLKSALTGDSRGERQGAIDALGAASIGNTSQAVASAIAGNASGASGTVVGQLAGAALEALAGDGRGERQGALDPIGAASIGNTSQAVASAIAGNASGATGAMVGQLAGAALEALAGDSREAARRAGADQRSDEQVAQTVEEMAAIANRQKKTVAAPPTQAAATETSKTPLQKMAPPPPQQPDSSDTVVLAYTPGKGFWDPAAGKFITSPDLMSCDNVTKSGVKLIDLPVDRRECVTAGPVMKKVKRPAVTAALPPDPARVATLQLVSPPDFMEFAGSELIAVNEGVYIALNSTDGFSAAGKYTPEGWLTTKIARGPVSIAIPNHRRQKIDEFSLRYIASDKVKGDLFGFINMNNGGIGHIQEDNDLHLAVTRYVTLLDDTESGRAIALGERSIYWQKPGWTGRNFTDQFDRHDLSGVSLRFAANTGAQLSVYMVATNGSSIVNVGVDGTHKESFDLSSFGGGPINTLIFKHHKLFVGYGDQILLIKEGKVSRLLKLEGLLLPQRATFCISNGSLYTADGRYVQSIDTMDIAASVRPFLVHGDNLPPEKMTEVFMMKAALQLGIYCEDGDYSPHVFALGIDTKSNGQKIFKIYPAR